MSPIRFLAFLVVLTTAAAGPRLSAAQDRPAAGAPLTPKQRDGERNALSAFAAGRYDEALNIYAELYADYRDPIYLRNIGRCHTKLKNPEKAIASFEEYLQAYKRITPRERDEVRGWIRDLQSQPTATAAAPANTGAPPPVAPPAGLAAPTAAPATTSAPSGTPPGPTLVMPSPPPPAPFGPPTAAGAPAESLQVSGGGPPRGGGTHTGARTAGVVATAVGAAALATGGVLLGLSWSKYGSAKDGKCIAAACLQAADSIDTRNMLSAAFLIGGAVVGATGTTLLVLFPVSRPDNTAAFNGLGVGATFAY